MTTNIAGPSALASAVRHRRLELGFKQADVVRNGGPSHQTIRNIEHAVDMGYRPSSLNKLDRALKWTAGTAQAIWDGTKPPSFVSPAPVSEDVQDEEDDLSVALDLVHELLKVLVRQRPRTPVIDDAMESLLRLLPEVWGRPVARDDTVQEVGDGARTSPGHG